MAIPFTFLTEDIPIWHNVCLMCLGENNLFVFKVWPLSQRQSKENDSSCMACKVHILHVLIKMMQVVHRWHKV